MVHHGQSEGLREGMRSFFAHFLFIMGCVTGHVLSFIFAEFFSKTEQAMINPQEFSYWQDCGSSIQIIGAIKRMVLFGCMDATGTLEDDGKRCNNRTDGCNNLSVWRIQQNTRVNLY